MNKKRQIKETVKKHIPQRHLSSVRIMYRIAMETIYGIKRTGLINIAIIAAIAAILTIFGALFRTSFSLSSYVDNLGDTFEISVYLKQKSDPVLMSSRINDIEHVKKVSIKTKEQAWEEMNDERLGRDPTIDKEMTYLNVWMEGSTDMDVEDIVNKEMERISRERNEHGKRALRSDTVSCIALIEKPNMQYMQNLSYEERKRFLYASHEEMKKLIHEWNPNWKILASVQHIL